ncbi:response regulator [Marinobacter salinus]|uniref:Response regulator n=1 Tax=Marinobacter salinus TaxID=1874317 RepID=A0A1D9GR84_9GAMM|nr:ANTAR domain-containing protein [Marinobacter salinus]AOY90021.1 response regulator [Marinobacter salinus]
MTERNQSFSSRRKLLLIDCDDRTQQMLTKSIRRLGMEATSADPDAQNLDENILAVIVEIDELQSQKILNQARKQALPIIALSRHETLSQIQSAIRVGATAMLNRPLTQSSVYTTLMMASNLKERINALEAENSRQSLQLQARPQIAKAVARLMTDLKIDEHDAFDRIRTLSMELNISIEAICADIEQMEPTIGVRK